MNELIKKLKFKSVGTVINSPPDLLSKFKKQGLSTLFEKTSKCKDTLVFINNKKDFIHFLKSQLKNIEPDSVLWFAYPKMSSGVITDVNRDIMHDTSEDFGITAVSAISINETWSALRFRPIDRVGKK